jgi:hypothetical protein
VSFDVYVEEEADMYLAPTLGYDCRTRKYSIYEINVLESGESFIGDVVLELDLEYGKALRKFYKYTGVRYGNEDR